MKKIKLAFVTIATLLSISVGLAHAQSNIINDIQIIGNKRIETATIESFLKLKKGEESTDNNISSSLSSVYATGLFANVTIDNNDGIIIVKVIENPIVSEVGFEGNKRISNEDLEKEVNLSKRSVYTKSALQKDVKRILNLYQKSGRFSASVVPKVIQLSQNRINIVYEIDEGKKSKINRISFVGNDVYNDNKLKRIISTKESVWYRFFSSDDTYDADRIAFDQELLRRFYISRGYADFRVLDASAELTPERDSFLITFTVDEGQIYDFGKINVESKIEDISIDQLYNQILTKESEMFNSQLVDNTKENIIKELGNLGYAFVKVNAAYKQDKETAKIGINYIIQEGPRVYVEKININGNVRTLDEVVRREFRIAEGDPYDAEKIKRSKRRINNLGFFGKADFNEEKGSGEDKVVIDVDVEEKSTGELTFGAGFSTTDGALGDVSITERNLLGKGQYLKLKFTLASVRQEIDLSFTEPYFMDKDIKAGFDLFKIKRTSQTSRTNRTYDDDVLGGQVRMTYALTEYINHTLRYSLRSDDITNVNARASTFIKLQEGKNTTSLVGHKISWDKRDNIRTPTEGFFISLNQDLSGFGGDTKFLRNELNSAYYLTALNKDNVVKFSAKGGYIFGYGDKDVRVNDRFFIGGNEIRGFKNDGIGPRDSVFNDPLGGNTYFATSVEMTFPLGLPEELGISGAVFTDLGTLFDNDDNEALGNPIFDDSSLRGSIGVGLAWRSPLGPIRIDFSHPYAKESYDRTEQIKFNFGTRF